MNTNGAPSSEKTFACETCAMRKKAEANPKSLMSRLWRWHTGWCPGWKAYQDLMLADAFIGPEFQVITRSRLGYLHTPMAARTSGTLQMDASVSISPAANSCQYRSRIAS